MNETRAARVTSPQAAALLRAVHRVRHSLGIEEAAIRHLTRALAETAGIPSEAQPWPEFSPLPDPDVLAATRAAMDGHRTLRVEHLRDDGVVAEIVVEPYHVRLERGYWFLISRDAESGAEQVLRMDKLQGATLGTSFTPRPVDMDRYLRGVFVPPDAGLWARVIFAEPSCGYAEQRWGAGTRRPDGQCVVEIPYQREHWLVRTLMEFGGDFEVAEPAELRRGVRERAEATLRVYQEHRG